MGWDHLTQIHCRRYIAYAADIISDLKSISQMMAPMYCFKSYSISVIGIELTCILQHR